MLSSMDKLYSGWAIDNRIGYAALVILLGLAVRALLSIVRAPQLAFEKQGGTFREIPDLAWRAFCGFEPKGKDVPADYWQTYILGLFELAVYPILIATGSWNALGAWFGVKTLAQWKVWSDNRATFNVFLIGNLLVLAAAYYFLVPFVRMAQS